MLNLFDQIMYGSKPYCLANGLAGGTILDLVANQAQHCISSGVHGFVGSHLKAGYWSSTVALVSNLSVRLVTHGLVAGVTTGRRALIPTTGASTTVGTTLTTVVRSFW